MQQLASRPQPDQQANRGGAPRSQVILIVALLLFSVAGLASGFSVGALSRKTSKSAATPTQITNIMPPVKGQSSAPTPKPTIKVIPLGCPKVLTNSSIYMGSQVPDGTTTYTFAAQAMDTTGDQPGKFLCSQLNQPIHAAGITFKLWVIKHIGDKSPTFLNLDQITQPIDGKVGGKDFPEMQNKLQFDTPQVQQSNDQGQVTWQYKINPDLKDGMYTLVVLTEWQGKTPNWSWKNLIVKKQG